MKHVSIGVTRGALGAHTPRADKKIWGRNLKRKVVSEPPGRAKSHILGHFCWAGEMDRRSG